MQYQEVLDMPPYYYIKAHPSTAGQWLPVIRISYSGAGFPSMYVRALQPGDYRHQWRPTEVEQAFVQRIDFAYVVQALESRQVQFIRPIYPPHVPQGVDAVGRAKMLDSGIIPLHHSQSPALSHPPRSLKRSASISISHSATLLPPSMLTSRSAIANHPSSRPRRQISSVSVRDSHLGDGSRIHGIPMIEDGMAPASPVLSDSTSSSSSSGGFSTSTATSQSSFNLSRSALNHYVSAQRPRERSHRGSLHYQSSDGVITPSLNQGPCYAPPTIHASTPIYGQSPQQTCFQSSIPSVSSSTMTGIQRQRTGRGANPVSYHEDEGPIYSSYELYNPHERLSAPSSVPRLARQQSGDTSPQLTGSAYGSGLGIGASPGMLGGFDRETRQGLKGKKWWKVGL